MSSHRVADCCRYGDNPMRAPTHGRRHTAVARRSPSGAGHATRRSLNRVQCAGTVADRSSTICPSVSPTVECPLVQLALIIVRPAGFPYGTDHSPFTTGWANRGHRGNPGGFERALPRRARVRLARSRTGYRFGHGSRSRWFRVLRGKCPAVCFGRRRRVIQQHAPTPNSPPVGRRIAFPVQP
jgi:hypothetical protein